MVLLVVRHKVRDFAAWKEAFDAHRAVQAAAGLSNARLFRSVDDDSEVIVLLDAADVGKAKQFVASPELKSAMEGAGVVDKPDIFLLDAAGRAATGQGD